MNYILVLIINLCSHSQQGFEQPGGTTALPSSSRGNLQQRKVFLEQEESQSTVCIPEKPYPTVSKKTCYFWTEITNKRFHCDVGNRQRVHYTEAISACTFVEHRFQEYLLYFFQSQKRRAWHSVSRVLLNLFSPCSDCSCKYVITVNASNASTASKTVQSCSYCICWSIITNVRQRQVNCQCFSLGFFTFTQTPTA